MTRSAMGRQMVILVAGLLAMSSTVPGADLQDRKAVLVTGASSGIGLRIAETLAENGFYVYAGARKADDLARLDSMDNISSVRLDVTSDEDIAAAARYVEEQGRGLWGVVNNAGVLRYASLASGPESEFRFTFDVNVFGPFRINQAFLPMLIESSGRTATISSINGFIPSDGVAGYATSKFAVEGYTDSLAQELEGTGVHVSAVQPGAYKSAIRDKLLEQALAQADSGDLSLADEERQDLEQFAASNEGMKEPDEVADAVLHLMTSESPKRRYMVTPNAGQAEITIRYAMRRVLELNEDQPYSYSRDELVALIDELLEESR